MSDVFQNIDPHPLTARRVCTSPPYTRWVERGWGINILEDNALFSTYVSLCVIDCAVSVDALTYFTTFLAIQTHTDRKECQAVNLSIRRTNTG
jgi:hypothetical protein